MTSCSIQFSGAVHLYSPMSIVGASIVCTPVVPFFTTATTTATPSQPVLLQRTHRDPCHSALNCIIPVRSCHVVERTPNVVREERKVKEKREVKTKETGIERREQKTGRYVYVRTEIRDEGTGRGNIIVAHFRRRRGRRKRTPRLQKIRHLRLRPWHVSAVSKVMSILFYTKFKM